MARDVRLSLHGSLVAIWLAAFACHSKPGVEAGDAGVIAPSPSSSASVAATTSATATAAPALRAHSAAKAGESVSVAAHTFPGGSAPGDDGRDPSAEPVVAPLAVTSFTIDALPYPNDPAQPPRTNVPRDEAQRLCAARGARLCGEVEWEAACKGPDGDAYASGAAWDDACTREPATCPSGYGVRAMGALREWTASTIDALGKLPAAPAIRGGGTGDRGGARCARRARAGDHDANGAADLGFRCCAGDAPGAAMPAIQEHPLFRKTPMPPEQLAKIVAGVPELARVGSDVAFFDPNDGSYIVRSKAEHEGVVFTTQPVLWSPETGAEVLVVSARGKAASFVAAFWPQPDGTYRLASSFVMLGEIAPVALAYRPVERMLWWTSCWQCSGETGHVSVREDHHVVIVQD
jgi:hypothetical protein